MLSLLATRTALTRVMNPRGLRQTTLSNGSIITQTKLPFRHRTIYHGLDICQFRKVCEVDPKGIVAQLAFNGRCQCSAMVHTHNDKKYMNCK